MTPADLLALAERVEREEPSWDLDIEIECAVFGAKRIPKSKPNLRRVYAVHKDGRCYNPRNPTSSLDAAASLVPKGVWSVDVVWTKAFGAWVCTLCGPAWPSRTGINQGRAPTEPRARTAAALRARAQEMADND